MSDYIAWDLYLAAVERGEPDPWARVPMFQTGVTKLWQSRLCDQRVIETTNVETINKHITKPVINTTSELK